MTAPSHIVRALLEDEEDDFLDPKDVVMLDGYPSAQNVVDSAQDALDGYTCKIARPFTEETYRRFASASFIVTKTRVISHGVRLSTEMDYSDITTVRATFSAIMREHKYVYTPVVRVDSRQWRGKPDEVDVHIICVRPDYRKFVDRRKLFNNPRWYMYIKHPDAPLPEPLPAP